MKKRVLAIALVVALIAIAAFGTLAYFTAETGPVDNTFVLGELISDNDDFVLLEHEVSGNSDGTYVTTNETVTENEYANVVPGTDLPKDPFIEIQNGDALEMDAYLFVEVVAEDMDGYTYAISDDWTLLSGVSGNNGGLVYYYGTTGIASEGFTGPVEILKDNQVSVTSNEDAISTNASLDFYSYLIQAGGLDSVSAAWEAVSAAK